MKVPVRGGCVKVVAASVAAVLLLPLCCGTQGSDLATKGPATVEGLIYYQDFDHRGVARCGDGWAVRQEVPTAELVPGRFERPRTNWLSANQASAETDIEGFVAGPGVTLQSAATETRFGQHVLRAGLAAAGRVWRTTPVTVRTTAPHRPSKVFVFSAYLRADRPGAKVRLGLSDEKESGNWRAEIPGLRRLDIATQSYPDELVQRELGGWATSVRDTLKSWANVTPAESVFTYVREAGPSRYVLLINDHRQSGPQFAKWKVMLNALGRKPLDGLTRLRLATTLTFARIPPRGLDGHDKDKGP